ncbi:MAG: lipopolysaccharide kinase InaA family protein [Pseudomonadales bacterium]|nr:lipopolysaccharide kinase InaA family protein [Pseudomonadales bacterium]
MHLANITYDIDLPFQISLSDAEDVVHCLEKVRVIPNKRLVCRGSWRGADVFIKFFTATKTAYRDFQREVAGSDGLKQHNISTAQRVYQGVLTEQRAYLVIYRSIQPALDLDDAWQAATENQRHDLLCKLTRVVAQHHLEGLSQQDMHLRNFIISEEVIYTLDAADIRMRKAGLNKRESFANLIQLFALISPVHDCLIRQALTLYIQIRGWRSSDSQCDAFMIEVEKNRQIKKEKYLRKVFRESSAFVSRRSLREFTVCDRLLDGQDLRQLLNNPDARMEKGEIIKQGNTCTIASVTSDVGKLIIKRYNVKGYRHALRRAFARTRAAISWSNAHRLQLYQISAAHPVALLERCFGPVHFQSYLVMGEVTGPTCWEFFRDPGIAMEDKRNVAGAIGELFKRLVFHKISHGDMKASNFVIHDNQPVLLDLDAMREHM